MNTPLQTSTPPLVYHQIPTNVSRKDFNRYIDPHLKRPKTGPKPKLSLYKIFNSILYVLHTGIQWDQLKTKRNELHYTNVYKWQNRWSKNGSYQALCEASIIQWHQANQLDTSVVHGDGSNPVGKKGAQASATPVTSIRKEKKSYPLSKTTALWLALSRLNQCINKIRSFCLKP